MGVFLNVYRRVNVVTNESFIKKNCVLVVITFPSHKADERVLTQGDFSLMGSGTVGNYLTLLNVVALGDDGTLIEAGTLVGSLEFKQLVNILDAVLASNNNAVSLYAFHVAGSLGNNGNTGVKGSLVLHTRTNDRRIVYEQRNRLLLHVGTHKCTGVIVIFKERNHSRCNGYEHLRCYVHIIDLHCVNLNDLGALTADNLGVDEAIVFIQGFVCLRNDEAVFGISGHIFYLVGNLVAKGSVAVIDVQYLAVGCLDKAVVGNASVGREIRNQTDVRAFGRLDGADTAVLSIVNVTHVKGCAVTGKTAGTECRQTALVAQLCQRVVLVHELRQLAGAKELADSGGNGTDVDESLYGQLLVVLRCHSFLYNFIHTRKADAELILQLLTDRADAAVAKVVDVVNIADVVRQVQQIADRCQNIVNSEALGTKVCQAVLDLGLDGIDITLAGFHNALECGNVNLFAYAAILEVLTQYVQGVNGVVTDNLNNVTVVKRQNDNVNACALNVECQFGGDDRACLKNDLSCEGADNVLGQAMICNAVANCHLFIKFITTYIRDVIASGVKEVVVEQGAGSLLCGGLAGTELFIDFLECLNLGSRTALQSQLLAFILFKGGHEVLFVAKEGVDVLAVREAKSANEHRQGKLAVFIDTDVCYAGCIDFIFEPCATVRNNGGSIGLFTCFINFGSVVHTGGTDNLRNDYTLCTVNDEGTGFGHQGEVTHKDVCLLNLACLLVGQANVYLKGSRIVDVSLFALLNGVLRMLLVQGVGNELDNEIAIGVGNGRRVSEYLHQAFLFEPFVGLGLNFYQIRQRIIKPGCGEAFSCVLTKFLIFYFDH